ncbi:MAG: hypothetical protein U1E14_11600 [Geminicoccaceae bacterium]
MRSRMLLAGLVLAGTVAATATGFAQTAYPDLKGTWVGPGQSVTLGKTDQWPSAPGGKPVFREGSWTVIIDEQQGNLLTGSQGLTDGGHRDTLLGVIRGDGKTILMVDDDGSFVTQLTGPDAMEMCRIEVTADSRLVGCRQLARQK